MKKLLQILLIPFLLTCISPMAGAMPIAEIIRQGVKRVIIATDLMVQRQQNETILLQNIQKVLENRLTELKLDEIATWGSKQRDLFENHYQSFRLVKSSISSMKEVSSIIDYHRKILMAYRQSMNSIHQGSVLRPSEKQQLIRLYATLFTESTKDSQRMFALLKNGETQMEDASRRASLVLLEQNLAKRLQDVYQLQWSIQELVKYRTQYS